jgi:thiosulfate/3-mercaptopyruvate sulfurtransferase
VSGAATDVSDALTDTAWVYAHLDDPKVVLLEVDQRPALYDRAHIPGAHSVDWNTDLQDPVRRDLPSPQQMTQLWSRLGIGDCSTVVFYGDLNNWLAAFGFWLFRSYGLSNLRLLDGGRQRWIAEEKPLSREPPLAATPSEVPFPRFDGRHRADRVDAAHAARRGDLIDVRTLQEYTGEWLTEPEYPGEAAHCPGHIPGARHVRWDLAIDLDGRFKAPEQLHGLYAAHKLLADEPIVTYCRIGERSAHTWFVLHEILGHPDVSNYDGSWTEWGSMTAMPIQLGHDPGHLADGFTP